MLDSFGQARLYSKKLAGGVRDYVPGVKQYYDSRQRIVAQQNFSMTLRNALHEYRFETKGKPDKYLMWFGPMTNTYEEWLDEATGSLGPLLGVTPIILRLVYADYASDLELSKNCWVDIWNDKQRRSELARTLISNGVVSTEYVENSLQSYGAIEELFHKETPFRLYNFRYEYNRFYVDFVREKRALIDAISLYNFKKSTLLIEDKIRKFVPSSLDEKKRLSELIDFAATEVGMPKEIVSLAFYEREGLVLERIRTFEKIRQSRGDPDLSGKSRSKDNRDLLDVLSDYLVTANLIETPTQYKADADRLSEFVAGSLSGLDDFTIAHANLEIRSVFGILETEKNTFLRTLFANKIALDETDRVQFSSWLPVTLSRILPHLET